MPCIPVKVPCAQEAVLHTLLSVVVWSTTCLRVLQRVHILNNALDEVALLDFALDGVETQLKTNFGCYGVGPVL